ncbi:hypothetical protein FACS1894174_06220 [Bacteroidia bacterium]|nr:hypothetical protein FACS1894155_09680 [Bacteroidia bacterium]GHV22077.1 hypothetical protein FACS1894174_06220 [Bacteroidia bacterium]
MNCFSQNTLPFQSGEQLHYDVSYKYGIMMIKAGTARYKITDSYFDHQTVTQTSLNFKTNSFFDKIFKIRDTLYSYLNPDLYPVYHKRCVNEGNTRFVEHLFFLDRNNNETEVRIKKETVKSVKLDTIMKSDVPGYDLLSIFSFARTLDYNTLKINQPFKLATFVGKRMVKINVRYKGQSIIEKSDNLKYNTFRLEVDIIDEVFDSEKNAMEIWISNDNNKIPIKMKAKLKIGAAEAFLTSYDNLKYPFSAEVRIRKK